MPEETIAMAGAGEGRSGRPRRRFLADALGLGAGALGLAGGGLAGTAMAQTMDNDPAILNFALNLEYLEAEFYTFAVSGVSIEAMGIATNGMGILGPLTVKANPQVPFATPAVQQYASEVADDERKHVSYIRSALLDLGVAPVARPAINLLDSFNTLASVAGLPTPFDPFANENNFLLGAYIFEDVGVTAYHGAAGLLKNKDILVAAAGILAVEAYHASLIRTILSQRGFGTATQAISSVRSNLGDSVDYGVNAGTNGTSSIVVADDNAIAPSRTTSQVLSIVYGGGNGGGLFFPGGMNGTIR